MIIIKITNLFICWFAVVIQDLRFGVEDIRQCFVPLSMTATI
jgi:hypothetical protein